jgi:hypothetical protein
LHSTNVTIIPFKLLRKVWVLPKLSWDSTELRSSLTTNITQTGQ